MTWLLTGGAGFIGAHIARAMARAGKHVVVYDDLSSGFAAFVPDAVLWELTSMGTLVAFMVVSAGVMILRRTQPDLPRGFRVPLYPVLPILSIVSCLYLICNLNPRTFELFAIWLVFAAIFYFLYSARNSRLEKLSASGAAARP